jgi:ferritin|tara:strand:+ start:3230 stop:3844 length:615 start_codon:yes stop_codon:yes gene_type:complete
MEAKPRMLKRPDAKLVSLENEMMDVLKPSEGASKEMPSTKTINPLIDESCISHLNYRVQQEEYSARIYMAMSMWLNNKGYVNAAAVWRTYSDEEMKHADIARTYLLSFGIQPVTPRLDQPKQNFSGLPEIIKLSFDHEVVVSKQIKDMANHALADGDHMLYELCLAYLKEQVEEHNKMQNWVDQLEAFGTDKIAMRLLDHEMAG